MNFLDAMDGWWLRSALLIVTIAIMVVIAATNIGH